MNKTTTQVSTKTKVLVSLLMLGSVGLAFGAGWYITVKVQGVPVYRGTYDANHSGKLEDSTLGPDIPKIEGEGPINSGFNTNTNSNGNGNSNSNTNSGGNMNSGGGSGSGGSTGTGSGL